MNFLCIKTPLCFFFGAAIGRKNDPLRRGIFCKKIFGFHSRVSLMDPMCLKTFFGQGVMLFLFHSHVPANSYAWLNSRVSALTLQTDDLITVNNETVYSCTVPAMLKTSHECFFSLFSLFLPHRNTSPLSQ